MPDSRVPRHPEGFETLDVLARVGSLRLPPVARLEFIPMKIGAGMACLIEGAVYKQILFESRRIK